MTSDEAASRAFHGELFGWTSESAGEDYGGYVNFSTADTDASVRRVVELGGTVIEEAVDTPHGGWRPSPTPRAPCSSSWPCDQPVISRVDQVGSGSIRASTL